MFSAVLDRKASDRGKTTELWKGIPNEGCDPRFGFSWFDDFTQGDASVSATGVLRTAKGIYTCTEVSTGTVAVDNSVAGVKGYLVTDPGATTVGQGYNIQGGPSVIPVAGKTTVFEARIATSIIAPQFLLGMTDDAAAAVTGGATVVVNTTNVTDAVAFTNILSNATGASLYPYNDKASETHVQGSTVIGTLVAATFIKLGVRINGVSSIEYWVDGSKVYTYTGSIIPAVAITPILVAQADGAQPVTTMDWWGLGQTP
jgi:hypothetical protein